MQDARLQARALLKQTDSRLERLRTIDPLLIDLSLRENPVGDRVGQTLAEKIALLPKIRAFGFTRILLGTLDYAIPDEPEVDDDFMKHLRDQQVDITGCYAFTAMGRMHEGGAFTPDLSMLKLRDYGVPNTLHEISLSPQGMKGQYDFATLIRSLPASIRWLVENVHGDHGGAPKILINIVDGCDAFAESPEQTLEVLEILAGLPVEGISFEDDRGTYLPFQVGSYVAAARALLPEPMKILVHMHSGAGYENASVMEALVNGADGIWGGLPKRAAIIGHASVGELIANLARIGNPHMQCYQLDQLLPFATSLQIQDEEQPVADDLPILGHNAYRLTLSAFRQMDGRFGDLVPETIGGTYGYRICPVVSDTPVIAGRLAEVTGKPADSFPDSLLEQMIRLMRRELRAGEKIVYDEPEQLLALYERAKCKL